MHADTIIENKTEKPIGVLYLNDAGPDYQTEIQIDGATLKQDDRRLSFRIYEFESAHAARRKAPHAIYRLAGAARV